MSFGRWLKYNVARIFCKVFAVLSFLGSGYSIFFFQDMLRTVGAVAGVAGGIFFLLLNHYYNIKIVNMYFLPGGSAALQQDKKKDETE